MNIYMYSNCMYICIGIGAAMSYKRKASRADEEVLPPIDVYPSTGDSYIQGVIKPALILKGPVTDADYKVYPFCLAFTSRATATEGSRKLKRRTGNPLNNDNVHAIVANWKNPASMPNDLILLGISREGILNGADAKLFPDARGRCALQVTGMAMCHCDPVDFAGCAIGDLVQWLPEPIPCSFQSMDKGFRPVRIVPISRGLGVQGLQDWASELPYHYTSKAHTRIPFDGTESSYQLLFGFNWNSVMRRIQHVDAGCVDQLADHFMQTWYCLGKSEDDPIHWQDAFLNPTSPLYIPIPYDIIVQWVKLLYEDDADPDDYNSIVRNFTRVCCHDDDDDDDKADRRIHQFNLFVLSGLGTATGTDLNMSPTHERIYATCFTTPLSELRKPTLAQRAWRDPLVRRDQFHTLLKNNDASNLLAFLGGLGYVGHHMGDILDDFAKRMSAVDDETLELCGLPQTAARNAFNTKIKSSRVAAGYESRSDGGISSIVQLVKSLCTFDTPFSRHQDPIRLDTRVCATIGDIATSTDSATCKDTPPMVHRDNEDGVNSLKTDLRTWLGRKDVKDKIQMSTMFSIAEDLNHTQRSRVFAKVMELPTTRTDGSVKLLLLNNVHL
jgi:hypothetical protein